LNKRHASRFERPSQQSQRGAALVVGLLLLVVLTLLAISGMNTATLDLQMAGNEQSYQNAFQAAETGIEQAIASGNYNTNAATVIPVTNVPGSTDTFQARTEFNCTTGKSPVRGYSMGISGPGATYTAYHFDTTSVGNSSRNSTSTHVQSFYIVGPDSPCL
jgi:type IV pilus assembly protein PilX